MNEVTWDDDENIDIESLQSDETDTHNNQVETRYNNDKNDKNGNKCTKNPLEDSSERSFTIILKDKYDENMDTNILRQNNTLNSITMDYVDVGSSLYHASKTLNETFENIQCKKQKIMICDQDKSFDKIKDGDIEVEKILVESDSIELPTVL